MTTPFQSDAPLALADELVPWLSQQTPDIERARHLPQPVATRLAEAGLYRMLVPRALGGLDTDPHTYVRVIERLATGDASAAWCTFISNTSALVLGYLPSHEAARVMADPAVRMAGVFAPRGRARPVTEDGTDGYRVSGSWSWGSGSMNAHHLTGGCLVVGDDGRPRRQADGTPEVRSMLFDAAQVTISDTWRSIGLAGTGSHDFAVDEVFVPAGRSAVLMVDPPRLAMPLYRFPVFGLLAIGIASVALGIARVAIDALVELAGGKTPQGSTRLLAERPATQQQVARAEARLRAARAWLLETIADTWRSAQAGGAVPLDQRRDLRLATTHATQEAAHVVDAMFTCAGGSAVFSTSPLARCLRDVHVCTQHAMVADTTFELTGRLLLGLETQTGML